MNLFKLPKFQIGDLIQVEKQPAQGGGYVDVKMGYVGEIGQIADLTLIQDSHWQYGLRFMEIKGVVSWFDENRLKLVSMVERKHNG